MSPRCQAALGVIAQAYQLVPVRMNTVRATLMLLAIGLQEGRLKARRQMRGPARGLWQFELGTRASRGGVWGVFLHPASTHYLRALCEARGVEFEPGAIYRRLEHDDVLAAGVARLLLWTHSGPLPAIGDSAGAWEQYLAVWNPGKPHPETWPELYAEALDAIKETP